MGLLRTSKIIALSLWGICLGLPPFAANACGPVIEITYHESYPDMMRIHNRSEEAWSLTNLTFDMTTSRGALIFDTVDVGVGEGGAQPYTSLGGTARLAAEPAVSDGDAVLLMLFADFGPGQFFEFALDLDDQLVNSHMGRTMVSGQEIAGAKVDGTLRTPDGHDMPVRGFFNEKNVAQLTALSCV